MNVPVMYIVINCCVVLFIHAHSWIDCIDTNRDIVYKKSNEYIFGGSKGNGKCKGYGLNYPGRGDKNINKLYTYKTLYDKVQAGAPLCQYNEGHYGEWRHLLKAKEGQTVYFGYLPNGHVVKDKMARGTKYGIYWSNSSTRNLGTTKELTSENLIDGKLYDFDDGNCGETFEDGNFKGKISSGRAGNGKPCIGSFVVPKAKTGLYRMVWYWKFYKEGYTNGVSAKDYYGAAYSTCFDIEIKGSIKPSEISPQPPFAKTGEANKDTTLPPDIVDTSKSPIAAPSTPQSTYSIKSGPNLLKEMMPRQVSPQVTSAQHSHTSRTQPTNHLLILLLVVAFSV